MIVKRFYFLDLGLFMAFLSLVACQETPKAPTPSVNPFDTTYVAETGLTAAEKEALLAAKGKIATAIEANSLKTAIQKAENRLHVFCFWRLGDAESTETAKALNTATANLDTNSIKVVFITDLGGQSLDQLNLFIREHQFTATVHHMPAADLNAFAQLVQPQASVEKQPLLLFVNNKEAIHMLSNNRLSSPEISALLQPLL